MSLQEQIDIKNKYLQLIIDIAFDYDGYRTPDALMGLIDEIRAYAIKALNNENSKSILLDKN